MWLTVQDEQRHRGLYTRRTIKAHTI